MVKTSLFIKLGLILAIGLILFYYVRSSSFQGNFVVTNISNKIQNNTPADYSGAILVNLDADADEEILVSANGSENSLLKYTSDKFVNLEIPELKDEKGFTHSATACDLNADGRDEILLLNTNKVTDSKSRIMAYENKSWKNILNDADLINKLGNSTSAACIDRKGDGKYGLVATLFDGKILYIEYTNGKFQNIADEIGLGFQSKGRSILGIPSPTGKTNILVGNEDANFYFVNRGDGTFSERAVEYGVVDANFSTRGIGVIDFNQDDIIDVIYGNHLGPVRLLRQNRDGKFTNVTPEIMANSSSAANAVAVADFNLDGTEDVYMNNIRNKNSLFVREGTAWYQLDAKELAEKDYYGVSTIVADLDNNGSYEILNTHGDGKKFPLTVYSIKPEQEWIKFDVKFKNGGIVRGAVVRLRTSKRDLLKSISSGSGRYANYGRTITYGILPEENILTVEVMLPSGVKQTFSGNFHTEETYEIIVSSPEHLSLINGRRAEH